MTINKTYWLLPRIAVEEKNVASLAAIRTYFDKFKKINGKKEEDSPRDTNNQSVQTVSLRVTDKGYFLITRQLSFCDRYLCMR
jgi:hypothetical protein